MAESLRLNKSIVSRIFKKFKDSGQWKNWSKYENQ